MGDEITYYAIINDFSSQERPGGVLRRIKQGDGERDETFGADLTWARSSLMHSYERGDLTNRFVPIAEDEAEQIVARIRQAAEAAD